MVQCVAAWRSVVCLTVLQWVAVCLYCVIGQPVENAVDTIHGDEVCVAVWCSVLQCVAVGCSVVQCVAVCCSGLQCVAV